MARATGGRSTQSPALPPTRLERRHLPVVSGWLLRSKRMLGADPSIRPLGRFAAAAAELGGDPTMSPPRISRWETGIHSVPHSVAERYEQIIGLPAGTLAAPLALLHRHFAVDLRLELPYERRVPALDKATHAQLADLVDRVRAGAAVTGLEWDRFTAFLTVNPCLIFARPDTAAVLARRLLAETLVADGLAWQLRFESFNRMLAHPVFAEDAAAACIAVTDEPHHPAVFEAVNFLDGSPHPTAGAFLAQALAGRGDDDVFGGALMAGVRRSRLGQFTAEECAAMVPALRTLVEDDSADLLTRRLALRILALLRAHPRTRQALDGAARAISQSSLPLADHVHQAGVELADDVLSHARDTSTAAVARFQDQTLPSLLRAAILDPVPDQRLYLDMLLNASPYRDAIATRAAHWLSQPPHPQLRRNLLTLVRVLGDARVADPFLAFGTDPDCDLGLRVSSLRALGHLGLPADSPLWRHAEGAVGAARDATTVGTLGPALAYALGVSGNTAGLRRLRRRLPPEQHPTVDWWLNQPAGVQDSLARG